MLILQRVVRNLKDGIRFGPSFPMRHVSRLLGREIHRTRIKGYGTIQIRTKSTDAQVFAQVFHGQQYNFRRQHLAEAMDVYWRIINGGQIPLIVDAGANVGASSIWFAKQFPLAKIIAIEPDQENAKICLLNTGRLANVELIEAAIGSEPGRVSISNPLGEAWAVRTNRDSEGSIATLTIPEVIANEPKGSRLFLVKIDIEGFESDLFSSNVGWLDEACVVIIEPHDWMLPGGRTSHSFQRALGERDYDILLSGENLIYVRMPHSDAGSADSAKLADVASSDKVEGPAAEPGGP